MIGNEASSPLSIARPPVEPRTMRRAVLAGVVGNYAEQYEFGVYAALSTVLATVFFPSVDSVAGQLSVFAGLAIGFLVRPVGGFIFGRLGDRVGRKRVLSLTIILMGFLTALIGCLPSYASVGLIAPALFLLLRLGQGLAAGGEYAGAVSFVVEYGPENQRGRYTSFVSISVFAGLLTGTAFAYAIEATAGSAAMASWGWRLPFLISLPLTVAGFYLRRAVQDTPEFRRQKEMEATATLSENLPSVTIRETLSTQWKPILVFSGFAITNAVLSYCWTAFLPSYLQSKTVAGSAPLDASLAIASTSLSLLVLLPLLYLSGRLSDRIGRKPMLLAGCVAAIVVVPVSLSIVGERSFAAALIGQLLYLIPIFFIAVTVTVCLAEMFPTRMRYTAGAISFNLSFSVFAGTAPFVATALVEATGTILAVAGYVAAVALVSLVVVTFFFRETYRKDLAVDDYNPSGDAVGDDPGTAAAPRATA